MSLDDYTDEELQEELDDRERNRSVPQPLEKPDYSNVFASAVEYITDLSETGCESKDCEHYMYEMVMEAVYGDKIWDYINEILL